ncbi:MAG: hypothetical protein R2710_00015 [Acidimicrobiales bacterium]
MGDIAVAAPRDDDGTTDAGAIYVLQLDSAGLVGQTKISSTTGGFASTLDLSDWFGVGLSSLGDLDGDGSNLGCRSLR